MRFQTVVAATCTAGFLGSATADIILASTSFEEAPVFAGVQYVDTGDPLVDHQLFNNVDQPFVEFISTGGEMGFTAFYFNTRNDGVGLGDGDFVGVTDFVGTVGAYTDGLNGYQMADPDGLMQVVFDTIDISGAAEPFVLLDYFIRDTTWETLPEDNIRIYVVTNDATEIDILDTRGFDIDDLGIEGFWTGGIADLAGFTSATLIVEVDSNSGREEVYLDNIRICDGLPAGAETVCADTFTQLRGIVASGSFADTCGSDDVRWTHQPDTLAATIDAPIVIEFSGTFTSADGVALRYTVEDLATQSGVVLNQGIFNFATGLFEGSVFPNIPTADTLHVVSRTTAVADYIGPGNEVRGSVSYLRPAGVPPFWNISIDEVTFALDQ